MTVPPPPTVPTGTVTHRYLGVSADGPDTDTAPDLIRLRAVTGVITPSTPRLVHTSGSAATTLECLPIQISYDASGDLQYTDPETGETQPGPLRLPANDDSIAPTITYEVDWSIPGLGRRWSGGFTLDAGDTVDLSTVGLASAIPGSSALFVDLLRAAAELEGVVDVVSDARDEAVAAADRARDISNIDTSDGVVAALVGDEASGTTAALDRRILGGPRLRFTDAYTGFFNGQTSVDNPTIWANPSHLNDTGLAQWAAHAVANAGITGISPKIVWFGDSWVAQNPAILASAVTNAHPGATVVNLGVSGNTSTQMLARINTIPADADYVIFNEPGVNDIYQGFASGTIARNLAALVTAIRDLGAVPVYTGMVPLSEHAAPAAARHAEIVEQISSPTFPALPAGAVLIPTQPGAGSLGVGGGLARTTTGDDNAAFGVLAAANVTSGVGNTLLGHEAGTRVTTGNTNTAVGQNSLRAATSGTANVAIGAGALTALTTAASCVAVGINAGLLNNASGNVFIGPNAGYSPGGVAANATTTAQTQTVIGAEAGQSSATQANDATAIGYRALVGNYNATAIGARAVASGHNSTAIGRGATASASGTVAIGVDNTGTAATAAYTNRIVLGTANHRVTIPGLPTTAPAAGSGILWNDAGTVKVA